MMSKVILYVIVNMKMQIATKGKCEIENWLSLAFLLIFCLSSLNTFPIYFPTDFEISVGSNLVRFEVRFGFWRFGRFEVRFLRTN